MSFKILGSSTTSFKFKELRDLGINADITHLGSGSGSKCFVIETKFSNEDEVKEYLASLAKKYWGEDSPKVEFARKFGIFQMIKYQVSLGPVDTTYISRFFKKYKK